MLAKATMGGTRKLPRIRKKKINTKKLWLLLLFFYSTLNISVFKQFQRSLQLAKNCGLACPCLTLKFDKINPIVGSGLIGQMVRLDIWTDIQTI